MSEPTYRITLERTYQYQEFNNMDWRATAYRIADDFPVNAQYGHTPIEATQRVQIFLKNSTNREPEQIVYATEDGELCDPPAPVEPQSLRA